MEHFIRRIILMFSCFGVFVLLSLKTKDEEKTIIKAETIKIELKKEKSNLVINYLEKEIQSEINNYIKRIAPNSKVKGEVLWEISKKYKIDIILILAQASLESHFGTTGKAKHTKSVFNVGTWDDGQIKNTYNDVNESIEPYAKLLSEHYLIDEKTNIDSLLTNNNFKNKFGYRFASNKHYEKNLKRIIRKIKRDFDIDEYLQIYDKLNNLNNELNKQREI